MIYERLFDGVNRSVRDRATERIGGTSRAAPMAILKTYHTFRIDGMPVLYCRAIVAIEHLRSFQEMQRQVHSGRLKRIRKLVVAKSGLLASLSICANLRV
jgi:hypothetical protein